MATATPPARTGWVGPIFVKGQARGVAASPLGFRRLSSVEAIRAAHLIKNGQVEARQLVDVPVFELTSSGAVGRRHGLRTTAGQLLGGGAKQLVPRDLKLENRTVESWMQAGREVAVGLQSSGRGFSYRVLLK